jgi:hypothetical protein
MRLCRQKGSMPALRSEATLGGVTAGEDPKGLRNLQAISIWTSGRLKVSAAALI